MGFPKCHSPHAAAGRFTRIAVWPLVNLLFWLLLRPTSGGEVIHVSQAASSIGADGKSWATAFPTLQTALTLANSGDEIWVATGSYLGPFVVKEGVALYGGFAGAENLRSQRNWMTRRTELCGADSGDARDSLQSLTLRLRLNDEKLLVLPPQATSAARIDGFTIRAARASFGSGIYSGGGSPVMVNNTIVENSATGILGGGGIFCDTASELAPQTPLNFFTNVAWHLFQTEMPDLRFDQIQIYPTNQYRAEVHRLLQVAANLFDATTNSGASYPYFPTVFRPVFTNDGTAVSISGFVEANDASFVNNRWLDLAIDTDRAALADDLVRSNANVFGQPIVIGAKKGFPNFNEFAVQTNVKLQRRLELRKRSVLDRFPSQTNQLFVLSISTLCGVEAWNSYDRLFARPLRLLVTNRMSAVVLDLFNQPVLPTSTNDFTFGTNFLIDANSWLGASEPASFKLPLLVNRVVLDNAAYLSSATPAQFVPFQTNLTFAITTNYSMPRWTLVISNRLQYALIDAEQNRIVDFVNLDPPVSRLDLTREIMGNPNFGDGKFWDTNMLRGVPLGIQKQILASLGDEDADWNTLTSQGANGVDKQKAIRRFNEFMGRIAPTNLDLLAIRMEAPYTPTRQVSQFVTWQANDPLVHYTIGDLTDLARTNTTFIVRLPFPFPTNSNLGTMNLRYSPWGGNPLRTSDNDFFAINPSVKDPEVVRSDDWDFPTERVVNLRWLDRVHRGTPWQTIYFGSQIPPANYWLAWSGSAETNPTNDWHIVELFRQHHLGLAETSVAPSHPVIVNNTIAQNDAKADGGVAYFASNVEPLFANNIVAFNSSGIFKTGSGAPELRNNCVFGNFAYDYFGLEAGARDLSVDPKFLAPQSGNFDLLATSPVFDAGDDSVLGAWLWADETARKFGVHIDIGAFELSPQAPPMLVAPRITDFVNGGLRLELFGFNGERYRVEASTNLIDWQTLETKITDSSHFELIDPTATNFNRRFYRAVRMP